MSKKGNYIGGHTVGHVDVSIFWDDDLGFERPEVKRRREGNERAQKLHDREREKRRSEKERRDRMMAEWDRIDAMHPRERKKHLRKMKRKRRGK